MTPWEATRVEEVRVEEGKGEREEKTYFKHSVPNSVDRKRLSLNRIDI